MFYFVSLMVATGYSPVYHISTIIWDFFFFFTAASTLVKCNVRLSAMATALHSYTCKGVHWCEKSFCQTLIITFINFI